MATATSDPTELTQAYRTQQVQRAALVATIVAAYYRSKVDDEDPASVEAWLDFVIPKMLSSHDTIASLAATYATEVRKLEVPKAPVLTFAPSVGAVEDQLKASLLVVGPSSYLDKMKDIRTLDVPETQRTALMRAAKEVSTTKIAAATARHVQNGGRQTLIDASASDTLALGYVRVTKPKPCFFCAMLASRGLVYAEDSFDASDARFTGDGKAKVHDSCGCTMKAVYTRKDPLLAATDDYADMWSRWGAGGGDAAKRFRRGYDHYQATGEYLDDDVVSDDAAYRARNAA